MFCVEMPFKKKPSSMITDGARSPVVRRTHVCFFSRNAHHLSLSLAGSGRIV